MPHQTDKDEDTEEQTNGKTKGKADKASVCFSTLSFIYLLSILSLIYDEFMKAAYLFISCVLSLYTEGCKEER